MAAAQPLRHGIPELVSESTIWHPGLRVPNLCLEYFLNLTESGCGGPQISPAKLVLLHHGFGFLQDSSPKQRNVFCHIKN